MTIPIAGQAPVLGIAIDSGVPPTATNQTGIGVVAGEDSSRPRFSTGTVELTAQSAAVGSGTNRPQVFADLSAISGISVNQLRQSLAIQRFVS